MDEKIRGRAITDKAENLTSIQLGEPMTIQTPQEKTLKYDYAVDPNSDGAAAHVLRFVQPNSKVLELGAGAGSISRPLIELNHCSLTALEVDQSYATRLASFCDRVIFADLNNSNWDENFSTGERFDFIVIADVLEHLQDPVTTLKTASRLLSPNGAVVVSVPNVSNNAIIACLLSSDFEYREWGLLDKTHIRFFSITNIEQLADHAGLKIIDAKFVIKPARKTEFSSKWTKLPRLLRWQLEKTNPSGAIYQVVFKAVPKHYSDQKFDLMRAVSKTRRHKFYRRSRRLRKLLALDS